MKEMGENLRIVELQMRQFQLNNTQLEKVSSLLLQEFQIGLSKSTHSSATVKMLSTYVRDVPDGTEVGKFLALDLGGSKFRVLAIDLNYNSTVIYAESEVYEIPKKAMNESGEQLFDHIAACLARFLRSRNLQNRKLPLGFTFSFPCIQTGLCSARLVQWTKGFQCSGVVDEDVAQLLLDALDRRGDIELEIIAIVNDTTGTLMSCAHTKRDCRIGLIIGTGTNVCYIEDLKNVEYWSEDYNSEPQQIIINTEWGAFGDNQCLKFIRTKYDMEVDDNSINPGKQLFEKMISGMYLGEIVRRIMVDFIMQKVLFNGAMTNKMNTPNAFSTQFLSAVELDKDPHQHEETKKVLEMMDVEKASIEDYEIVKLICNRVSTRAAFLVSSGIATILNKIQRPQTTIGVDGSVYRYHPYFKTLIAEKIKELTCPDYKFELMLSTDGSGRGAALVAAVAVRSLH